jgi:hypothetical protein
MTYHSHPSARILGQGETFNIGKYLEETSPYFWALLGIALCVGFSVMGAGLSVDPDGRERPHVALR